MIVTWASSYVSDLLVNKGYASTDVVRKVCNTLSKFIISVDHKMLGNINFILMSKWMNYFICIVMFLSFITS